MGIGKKRSEKALKKAKSKNDKVNEDIVTMDHKKETGKKYDKALKNSRSKRKGISKLEDIDKKEGRKTTLARGATLGLAAGTIGYAEQNDRKKKKEGLGQYGYQNQ